MPAMSKKDQNERFEAIAALLRQAENAGTPEEARVFSEGAMRLAKKYEIDLTMARVASRDKNAALRQTDARRRTEQEEKDRYEVGLRRPKMQQMALGSAVFRFAGCYLLRFGTGNSLKLVAFGYTSDIATGRTLYESLSTQAVRECAVRYKTHKAEREAVGRAPEVERTFRRGFWDEFARIIDNRLQAIGREVTDMSDAAEPGSALAIRSKDDEIKSWVTSLLGPVGKPRRRRVSKSYAGYLHGRDAGQKADIGLKQVGSTKGELPR
jgi:hypothetical protein